MIARHLPRSRILGTGHYLPELVRTNQDLERMVDTSDVWIRERTGIKERRIAPDGVVTSDMAATAGQRALDAAGLAASAIDMIIVGTVTPDVPMPATAVFVQQKLGAGPCPAFDLSAACAGFLFGMSIADQFIATGQARHVLVVGVELLSRVVDWTNRTTCVLFGDGAGAVVLGPSGVREGEARPRGVLSTSILTDGSLAKSLWIPAGGSARPTTQETVDQRLHYVAMRGQDIFKVAVKNLLSACKEALDRAAMTTADIDWMCPHQANKRIIDASAVKLGIAPEKVVITVDKHGNTSAASIPLALSVAVADGRIKKGDLILLEAMGGGFTWGATLVRW